MRAVLLKVIECPPHATGHGGDYTVRLEMASKSEQRLKSVDFVAAFRNLGRRRKIAEQRSQISGIEPQSSALHRYLPVDDLLPFHHGFRGQRHQFEGIAQPDHVSGERL